MTSTRTRRQTVGGLAISSTLFLALMFPSGDSPVFNGLPLSNLPEFVALVLVVPLLLGRALRRFYLANAFLGLRLRRRILLAILLGVILAKSILLCFGGERSFRACYQPLVAPIAPGRCEASYENPFGLGGVTRFDQFIDFRSDNWNLSFLNSTRFNFYPWINGNILRDRLPFTGTWTALIEEKTSITARAEYVGEVNIRIDANTWILEREYDKVATRTLTIPPGRHRIAIQYRFDDGYRVGADAMPGPKATFHLYKTTQAEWNGGILSPLRPAPPAWPYIAFGWLIDAALLVVLVDIARVYAGLLKREAWLALLPPGILLLSAHAPFEPSWEALALLLPLFAILIARHRSRRLLLAYLAIVLLTSQRADLGSPHFRAVSYRSAGNDWLTYESLARSILERRSLQAGEAVFYYQPLSRYETFLLHLLLGDGDTLVAITRVATLHFAVFWMLARIWPQSRHRWRSILLAAAAAAPLLGVLNAPTIVAYIRLGTSESLTWSALPAVLGLLFSPSMRPRQWIGGTMLLGASVITRANQAPAWLIVHLIHQAGIYRRTSRVWWRESLILFGIVCLPLLHNLYYGHSFVIATASATIRENLVLPPRVLLGLSQDLEARRRVWEHLKAMFCVGQGIGPIAVYFHWLQGMWLVSSGILLLTRRQGLEIARLLLTLPILFLMVHLFYQVNVYYPRHIVIGHLAMGLVAISGVVMWIRSGAVRLTMS